MRTVRLCLIGLAWSVALIGLVDGTFAYHVIQILPILIALRLLTRSPGHLGAYAAVTLFIWWIAKASLIWLFLLDVWTIAEGAYSPLEVALSVVIAFFGAAGTIRGVEAGRRLASSRRAMTVVVFVALQVAASAVAVLLASN